MNAGWPAVPQQPPGRRSHSLRQPACWGPCLRDAAAHMSNNPLLRICNIALTPGQPPSPVREDSSKVSQHVTTNHASVSTACTGWAVTRSCCSPPPWRPPQISLLETSRTAEPHCRAARQPGGHSSLHCGPAGCGRPGSQPRALPAACAHTSALCSRLVAAPRSRSRPCFRALQPLRAPRSAAGAAPS